MSAPTLGETSTLAQPDLSSRTPIEVIVHVVPPQEGSTKKQETFIGLSVESAKTKATRKEFYQWKLAMSKTEEFKALQANTAELKPFLEETLRTSVFGPESFSVSIVMDPQQSDIDKISNGIQLAETPTSKTTVDLAITPRTFPKLPGQFRFHVNSANYIASKYEASKEILSIVNSALTERYSNTGSLSAVLNSDAKGSTLRGKLYEELKSVVGDIFEKQGWDYNDSILSLDMRRIDDQEVETAQTEAEQSSAGNVASKEGADT